MGICQRTQGRCRSEAPAGHFRLAPAYPVPWANSLDDRRRRIAAPIESLHAGANPFCAGLLPCVNEATAHRSMHRCHTSYGAVPGRFNYLRGYLWSGRRAKFEDSVDRLLELLDRAEEIFPDIHQTIHRAAGHLCDLAWYIRKNESGVINYGQWRRDGRRISSSAVEGTVNRLIGRRLCKGQHMCWTNRGAHLLLQVRCAVLNGELVARFQRWFPAIGTRQIGLPWNWLPHHS